MKTSEERRIECRDLAVQLLAQVYHLEFEEGGEKEESLWRAMAASARSIERRAAERYRALEVGA